MPALDGIGVAITRPAGQAAELCALLESQGARVLPFPALEILPSTREGPLQAALDALPAADLAIFISANAVRFGLDAVRQRLGRWPETLRVAAVGQATSATLEQQGLAADIVPAQDFSAAGLLAHPALQAMAGRRVIIFRGAGGREVLAAGLSARGAQVRYAEVYVRRRPRADFAPLDDAWRAGRVQILTVASGEALENLFAMAAQCAADWFPAAPVALISERLVARYRKLGGRGAVSVARQASDQGLLEAVVRWRGTVNLSPDCTE